MAEYETERLFEPIPVCPQSLANSFPRKCGSINKFSYQNNEAYERVSYTRGLIENIESNTVSKRVRLLGVSNSQKSYSS